jgi:hypothetical protein
MDHQRLEATLHGAVAGVIAAAPMTLMRMLVRRAGLIDTMMPQTVEQWAREAAGAGISNPGVHSAADQAIHLGYGMLWGALHGATFERRAAAPLAMATLGIAQWLTGPSFLLPLLNIARPPSRSSNREVGVNLAAHALYAAITGFVTEELSRQGDDPRRQIPQLRHLARVG